MNHKRPDPQAVTVAERTRKRESNDLVILFGSRARGDHRPDSDIDILMVGHEPNEEKQKATQEKAKQDAEEIYGRKIEVQLTWRTLEEFRGNRRYRNILETRAVRDGVIMPRNPEDYSSRYGDEENEYQTYWRQYEKYLSDSIIELDEFVFMAEHGRSDRAIGEHAHGAMENAMKALLEALEAEPTRSHEIADLLGYIRRLDPEMREFSLQINAHVYTEYGGSQIYRIEKSQPELTGIDGYLDKTVDDVHQIIERAITVRTEKTGS